MTFQIYRNLHHKDMFSIREKGLVVRRLENFVARDVTFRVWEGGRKRVLRERKKNVHAFVVADRFYEARLETSGLVPIKYNPYEAGHFTCNGRPIEKARAVCFREGRCYFIL
jgi:hypothetical protein